MTRITLAICLLLQFTIHAQFSKIKVNSEQSIPLNTLTLSTGAEDLVAITQGELYHISPKNDTSYQFEVLEGTLPHTDKLVLHDIDQDGDKDLLSVQAGEVIVHVFVKRNGIFHYTPEWNFTGGNEYLATGDFNGDGFEDLVKNFSILVSTGANMKQFAARLSPMPSQSVRDLQFWDFDSDGDKDVIYNKTTSLVIHGNNGTSLMDIFTTVNLNFTHVLWSTLINTTAGPRFFLYDTDVDSISMLTWNGEAFNLKNMSYVPGVFPREFTTADLNADGNEEIVFSNGTTAVIFSFDPETEIGSISSFTPGGVEFGVVQRPTGPAIFTGNTTKLSIIEVDSNFQPVKTYTSNVDIVTANRGFGDFDGDGFVDILATTSIKRYLDKGIFEPLRSILFPSSNGDLTDFDSDGDLDFIEDQNWYANLGNYSFGSSMPVIINDPTPIPQIQFTREVLRKDLDGDGDLDILTYNHFGEPLQILKNNANQFFEMPVTLATNTDISGEEVYINAHDLDKDGILDILVAAASGMIMIKGKQGLTYESPVVLYDTDHNPLTIDIEDINSDGYPDIVLGTIHFQAGSVFGQVVFFKGTPDLPQSVTLHSGGGAHRAYFANIDKGGWKDIVSLHYGGLFWSKTINGSSFVTEQIDTEYIPNQSMAVHDVNSDGDDDIILSLGTDIYYYLNNEDGLAESGCPDRDLYYFNQTQVDRFKSKYGTCKVLESGLYLYRDYSDNEYIEDISCFQNVREIKGDLGLKGFNTFPDLTGFTNLMRVGGNFDLEISHPYDFHGIEKLKYVGGDFTIKDMSISIAPSDLHEFNNLDTLLGGVYLENVSITTLKPLIHDVIHGDFSLINIRSLTNQDSLHVLDSIKGILTIENTLWTTLTGFSNLEYIEGLALIRNGLLSKIGILNNLIELNSLLHISNNPLLIADNGLNSLERIYGDVNIYNSNFSLFNGLQHIGGNCNLTIPSLQSFDGIEYVGGKLFLYGLDQYDLDELRNLDSIHGDLIVGSSEITSLSGLENIVHVAGDFSPSSNSMLSNINNLNDALRVEGMWRMEYNPMLDYCNSIPFCHHVASGGEYWLWENGEACSDISQVECLNDFFSGFVYYDYNQNQILDDREALLTNIHISNDADQEVIITSTNGYYAYSVTHGESVKVQIQVPDDWEPTTSTSILEPLFVPGDAENYGNNFGLNPLFQRHDLSLTHHQGFFRCDGFYELELILQNNGTFAEYALVTINYPEHVELDPAFNDYLSHDQVNNLIMIEYDTVYPFSTEKIVLPLIAPSSEFISNDFVTYITLHSKYDSEVKIVSEKSYHTQLRCAYDPNDKQVSASDGTADLHFNSTDELVYTVRFQNTGNLAAETVRLTDMLSEYLDPSTFKFISASHPVEIRLKEGAELEFIFENINLPDSLSDYVGSQGYVMFSIKAVDGLVIGAEIYNDANIYFDTNDPILTNLVKTEVIEVTDLVLLPLNNYSLYPNPASDRIYFEGVVDGTVEFRDMAGHLVFSTKYSGTGIPIKHLPTGLYSCRLIMHEGIFITQFFKCY